MLPTFFVYAVFLLFPLARAVQFSLYDFDGTTVGSWVGLGNYTDVVTDERLRAAFLHASC